MSSERGYCGVCLLDGRLDNAFLCRQLRAAHEVLITGVDGWPEAATALRLNAAICGLLDRLDEGRSCGDTIENVLMIANKLRVDVPREQ